MIQVLGQGLGPDNDAVGMERTVLLVSGRGVVVTANIQIRETHLCGIVRGRFGGHFFNHTPGQVHQHVEEGAGGNVVHRLTAVLILFPVLFVAVYAAALADILHSIRLTPIVTALSGSSFRARTANFLQYSCPSGIASSEISFPIEFMTTLG